MTIAGYFKENYAEPMPAWLAGAKPGMRFPRVDFFRSRTVYYPGSGFDGQAVKVFGSSTAAHCFIYVDFNYTLADVTDRLASERRGFRGYRSVLRLNVGRTELRPTPWLPQPIQLDYCEIAQPGISNPFAILEILERTPELDDNHGPRRLAVLFIAGCGFATFDALFTQSIDYKPFAILLQDHGFAGNPSQFGEEGILAKLAITQDKLPEFLLVGRNTKPWYGYRKVEGLAAEPGGMHATPRSLYIKDYSQTELNRLKKYDRWI